MAVQIGFRPVHSPVGRRPQPPRSQRADLVLLRQGLDIALAYFNHGTRDELPKLTAKATAWSNKYFRGYQYAATRPTGLLKKFPDLFNLDIESVFRLLPVKIENQSGHPTSPEGTSIRDQRRAERQMTTEPFPTFTEPTLASDADMDEVIDLRRRLPPLGGNQKPIMRVDALMLRGSGLLDTLPEFLGQLARANLELETELATAGPDPGDNEEDEMNVLPGAAETQGHARRFLLPGGRSSPLPGDESSDGDAEADDDAGNETDASTSTTASLRVNLKKRKARAMAGDEEDEGVANKLRIHYDTSPAARIAFDRKRRKLVKKMSAEDIGPVFPVYRPEQSPSPAPSSSSSSSGGPTRIIKITVPESMRSSPRSSRSGTPGSTSSKYGIIKLKDPRSSRSVSPRSVSPPRAGTPESAITTRKHGIIKLRDPRSSRSASPRSVSPSSLGSSGSRRIRIKLVRSIEAMTDSGSTGQKTRKPLIEEL
ncbi:hypothetical protein QBC47DRAFT_222980 [Echria macrotheca]|uniref:Uncharacterized protein n=1 Tax=Echria macrotheca TaxID=438768 RepID=A0AAJ0F8S0_9PEZI|nr:hypothetical protein QBC47DRAFT_222980 [Echria macrotheca]